LVPIATERHCCDAANLDTETRVQNIQWLELINVLARIAASYGERGIDGLTPQGDFYLQIPTNEMFDVHIEPSKPWPIGSLADDWRELRRLIDQPEPFATAVDVERLGNLLRAISEAISPTARTPSSASGQHGVAR
jgi:hypothetical protein